MFAERFQMVFEQFDDKNYEYISNIPHYTAGMSCIEGSSPLGYAKCTGSGEGYIAMCAEWRFLSYEGQVELIAHEDTHKVSKHIGLDERAFFEDLTVWYMDEQYGTPETNVSKDYLNAALYTGEFPSMEYRLGYKDAPKGVEDLAFLVGNLYIGYGHISEDNRRVIAASLSPEVKAHFVGLLDDNYIINEPSSTFPMHSAELYELLWVNPETRVTKQLLDY